MSVDSRNATQPRLIEWICRRFSGAFDFSPCYQRKGTLAGCRKLRSRRTGYPDRSELVKQGDRHGPTVEAPSPHKPKGGRRSGQTKATRVVWHPCVNALVTPFMSASNRVQSGREGRRGRGYALLKFDPLAAIAYSFQIILRANSCH